MVCNFNPCPTNYTKWKALLVINSGSPWTVGQRGPSCPRLPPPTSTSTPTHPHPKTKMAANFLPKSFSAQNQLMCFFADAITFPQTNSFNSYIVVYKILGWQEWKLLMNWLQIAKYSWKNPQKSRIDAIYNICGYKDYLRYIINSVWTTNTPLNMP